MEQESLEQDSLAENSGSIEEELEAPADESIEFVEEAESIEQEEGNEDEDDEDENAVDYEPEIVDARDALVGKTSRFRRRRRF